MYHLFNRNVALYAVALIALLMVTFSFTAFAQLNQEVGGDLTAEVPTHANQYGEVDDQEFLENEFATEEVEHEEVEDEEWLEDQEWIEDNEEEEGIEEEDEEFDEDDLSCELGARIERVQEIAEIVDSKLTLVAFALELLAEEMEPGDIVQSLERLLESVDEPAVRRVIGLRLAQLYAELDQPEKMQRQLIDICK